MSHLVLESVQNSIELTVSIAAEGSGHRYQSRPSGGFRVYWDADYFGSAGGVLTAVLDKSVLTAKQAQKVSLSCLPCQKIDLLVSKGVYIDPVRIRVVAIDSDLFSEDELDLLNRQVSAALFS